MIRIEGLTKIFPRSSLPAIESVSFNVNDGEIVGFVGLNGAGKTTTIRIGVGVALPTKGAVSIDGHDMVEEKVEASSAIGWVPELPNFEPNARAEWLMRYFAGFYGISGSEAEERIQVLLASVGLTAVANRKFRNYSQGMKKRLALAGSLINNPRNLLFDEVLNGLDPEGIRYFRNLMLDCRAQGKAVLLSSHILAEVQNVADRTVIIHKGRVVRTVTRAELLTLGSPTVKVVVRDLDPRSLEYLKGVAEVRVEGNAVFLSGMDLDPAKIATDLITMGYSVSELTPQSRNLEDYFLDTVSERK